MRGVKWWVAAFAVAVGLPSSANAELRAVDLKVQGMDCATCAYSVRVGLQKMPGVESVEVSLEMPGARIRLRPGNKITLAELRRVVKQNGFDSGAATVTAVATISDRGGNAVVNVAGTDMAWPLAKAGGTPAVRADAVARSKSQSLAPVEVTGTVAQPAKAGQVDEIVLTAIRAVAR